MKGLNDGVEAKFTYQKFCASLSVGQFRLPYARTGGVLMVAHRRVKHTDTIFYVVRQIVYIHGRESILFRDRERIQ